MGVRETFKQNLKFYRKNANLTQEELSEKCGFNLNYIAEIECQNSRFPKPETIDAIAAALKINPSSLFMETGCPKNAMTFDKEDFTEKVITELSGILKKDVLDYLKRNGV